jgi:Transposase
MLHPPDHPADRVRESAVLLTARRGHDLDAWMTTVEADELPALHAVVNGLRMDLPAIVAGLTLPFSNDPIEGANTKVKFLKRQMYGRAGFPLLRQRILLAENGSSRPPSPCQSRSLYRPSRRSADTVTFKSRNASGPVTDGRTTVWVREQGRDRAVGRQRSPVVPDRSQARQPRARGVDSARAAP